MLSDRSLSVCLSVCLSICHVCLSRLSVCLSVTLVYCGQTVGWIKMPLGTELGVGPVHIVLDEHGAPPKKAQHPHFSTFRPTSIVGRPNSRPSQLLLSTCYGRPM